jgi:hypothetical protein
MSGKRRIDSVGDVGCSAACGSNVYISAAIGIHTV